MSVTFDFDGCDEASAVNLTNANARLLFAALGLEAPDLHGSAPLSAIRRGIMRAANRGSLKPFMREYLATSRVISFGVDEDQLRLYIGRLQVLVTLAENAGALQLEWA